MWFYDRIECAIAVRLIDRPLIHTARRLMGLFLFPAHVPCVKRMLTLSGRCVSRCCDVLVGKSALLQRYFLSLVSFRCRNELRGYDSIFASTIFIKR